MSVIPVPLARSTAGPSTDPTTAVAIFAVLGTAAAGTENDPRVIRSDADPEAIFTAGPLVEACKAISGYSRQATVAVRLEEDDPGDYGVIDLDRFTGTAVPAAHDATVPYNAHEVYIVFPDGTSALGTAGAAYKWSADGGRTLSGRIPLGTATQITIVPLNVRIDLGMPSAANTALVSLVNDLRGDLIAHFALTAGSVHGAADTTSDDGFGSAAVTVADAITLINQLVTGYDLHRVKTAGGVHGGADSTNVLASPWATTPAVDGPTAVGRAIALKNAYNAHRVLLSGSVHGAADSTNVTSAADPGSTGTIVAGDIIEIATIAPTYDAAAVAAALEALADYRATVFGGLFVVGSFPTNAWGDLIEGIDALRTQQRPVVAVLEARLPEDGETPTIYRLALEDEWADTEDERVYVCAGGGRYDPTTLRQLPYQSLRTHAVPLVARLARLDYGESPGLVDPSVAASGLKPSKFGGRLDGYRIYDSAGALIGHDESVNPGLRDADFGTLTSLPLEDPSYAFVWEPLTRAPDGNTAPHIAQQRVINVVEQLIYLHGTRVIQSLALLEPGRNTIRSGIADVINGNMNNIVRGTLGGRISSFFFEIDKAADISGTPTSVPFTATLETGRYISELPGTLRANQGA